MKSEPKKDKMLICDFCGKEYYVITQRYNSVINGKQKSKSCSKKCKDELEKIRKAKERENWPTLICDFCGKEYRLSPFWYSEKMKNTFQTCSFACTQKMLGEKHKKDAELRHEAEWNHQHCEYCDKEYLVDPKNKVVSKYCSRECKNLAKTRDATVYLKCQQCGKEISVLQGQINFFGETKYCSDECRSEGRKKRQIKVCTICGTEYEVHDCYAEKSVTCSRECLHVWISEVYTELPEVKERLRKQGTTSHMNQLSISSYTLPEKIVLEYFEEHKINFLPQFVIGDILVADFYLPDYNCVFEVYGDYWHCNPRKYGKDKISLNEIQIKNKQRDIRRYKVITKKYKYLFYSLWEYDIKNNLDESMNKFFEYIDSKIRNE